VDYYNEHDKFAAAWLRELIADGQLPPGDVDERDIQDVRPTDLAGYAQCHFFAGIGGWKLALMRAGWPDNRPVWTGSCPCQPFSAAGKRAGTADERHLWPSWFWLIQQCGPATVFGEQVASPDALVWLDIVQPDLEGAGYAVGVADMCAAGVGAPHIRQRLWFVADSSSVRCVKQWRTEAASVQGQFAERSGQHAKPKHDGELSRRFEGLRGVDASSPTNGFWRDADWLYCRDDKWRPVEPGTFPLAHGVPNRVGALRGYGNAINQEVGATFIRAVM
jgi:DNA (cytosine-5)-methyltransferase 1